MRSSSTPTRLAVPIALALLALDAPLLAVGIPVGGIVVDAEGEPLAGAKIALHPQTSRYESAQRWLNDQRPEPVATATSDNDGRYALDAPEPGMWRLLVAAEGRAEVAVDLVPLLRRSELRPIALAEARTLEVRVIDRDGTAVPRAQVGVTASGRSYAFQLNRQHSRVQRQLDLTDESGVVRLSVPAQGDLTVQVLANGFAPLSVEEASSERITARLELGVESSFVVVDAAGEPISGALLLAGHPQLALARSDAEGLVGAVLDEDERHTVRALAKNGAIGRARETPEASEIAPLPIQIDAAAVTLAGLVLETAQRGPLPGAMVWDARDPAAFVTTDTEGRYRLQLPASGEDGRARLSAAADGYFTERAEVAGLRINEGRGPTLVLRPGGMVRGQVVDAEGREIAEATVRAQPVGAGGVRGFVAERATRSDRQGRFELTPLDPEEAFQVEARKRGYSPAKADLGRLEPGKAVEVRLELRVGHRAYGNVVDSDDLPVAGAEVRLFPTLSGNSFDALVRRRMGAQEPIRVLSDGEGRFELRDLEPRPYDLHVEAVGFAPTNVPAIEILDSQEATEIGTVVLPPGVTLEGVVADSDGVPLAGVAVRAEDQPDMLSFGFGRYAEREPDATTDVEGRFEISDLAEGQSVNLEVSKDGYAPESLSGIRAPTIVPLEIRLEVASTLSGHVVDESGDGVPNAMLQLTWQMGSGGGVGALTAVANLMRNETSAGDGSFEIGNLKAGLWDLGASGRGYQPAERKGIAVKAGEDPPPLRLVLRRGATIRGRVFGADGEPVARATVTRVVQNRRPFQLAGQIVAGRSDGEGNYLLEGLPTGRVSLQVEHREHQKQVRDLEVLPGENLLDFRLERGLEISGRLIDDTVLPVAGATVQANSPSGGVVMVIEGGGGGRGDVTGADGSFTLHGLSDGAYYVTASKTGYATARTEEPLRLEGRSLTGVELRLVVGAAIRGTISGLGFDELGQVRIMAMQPGASAQPMLGQVNYDGDYRLDNLAPGDWMVFATVGQGLKSQREAVTLDPGVAELVVDLEFGGGLVLSGQVLRGDRPVSGYNVFAVGKATANSSQGVTDQDGRFRLESLEADTYRLAVLRLGGSTHEEEVELDADREILVELSESELSGRVVDDLDGSPVGGAEISLTPTDEDSMRYFLGIGAPPTSDDLGAFRIASLAPGGYSLSVTKEGYSAASLDVEVPDGGHLEGIEVRLRPASGLTLFVLQPGGTPAGDVRVAALDDAERSILSGFYRAGEGGRLRLADLPAGNWTLLVGGSGHATARLRVSAPGEPVTVALPESGGLRLVVTDLVGSNLQARVTLRDPRGQPYMTLGFQTVQKRFPLIDGRAHLATVPVGIWTLEIETNDEQRSWSTVTRVVPGFSLDVVVE